jgi:hypothetical protein
MADAVPRKGRGFRVPLSVLILSQSSTAAEELFRACDERLDLWTIRVPSVTASVAAMQVVYISLIIVAPEIPSDQVSALLAEIGRLRNQAPVLLLRSDAAEIHPDWQSHRMAVLRCPLVPGLLSRTVDLALQSTRKKRAKSAIDLA